MTKDLITKLIVIFVITAGVIFGFFKFLMQPLNLKYQESVKKTADDRGAP